MSRRSTTWIAPALRPTDERIITLVAQRFRLRPEVLLNGSHRPAIARPRMIGMYLARQFGRSFLEAARLFGRRDHSTAFQACRTVAREIAADPKVRRIVNELHHRILDE